MEQAILIFPNEPTTKARPSSRISGLSLVDRQIRTLHRAGIKHLIIIVPHEIELDLPSWTQKLSISKNVIRHGEKIELPNPNSSFLTVFAEYVHHHRSISKFLSNAGTIEELIVQSSLQPLKNTPFHRITEKFAEKTDADTACATGLFLCPPSSRLANSFCQEKDPWQIIAAESVPT